MKLILYILAILVIIGGGYLTYQNRENLLTQQSETTRIKGEKEVLITNEENERAEEERLLKEEEDTQAAIEATKESISFEKDKEARLKKTIASLEGDLRDSEAELQKFVNLINQVEEVFEERVSIDEVPQKIEELRLENETKIDTYDNLVIINERLTKKVEKETGEKNDTDGRLSVIRTRVAQNAVTATVTSVNADWGFVIINAGSKNSTIEPNTELVVKRGNQYLGKIKAAQVEETKTICDVEGNGVGALMRAGDKVILRTAVVK